MGGMSWGACHGGHVMGGYHGAQFTEFEKKEEKETNAATACGLKPSSATVSITGCLQSVHETWRWQCLKCSSKHTEPAGSLPQKRFKFLAKKLTTPITTEVSLLMPDMELASYIAEYQAGKITTSELEFWQQKQLIYPVLASLAIVLISMPVSDVYSERVFSLCDDFCAQKRIRMSRSLDRSLLKNERYSFVSIVTEKDRDWTVTVCQTWWQLSD